MERLFRKGPAHVSVPCYIHNFFLYDITVAEQILYILTARLALMDTENRECWPAISSC